MKPNGAKSDTNVSDIELAARPSIVADLNDLIEGGYPHTTQMEDSSY